MNMTTRIRTPSNELHEVVVTDRDTITNLYRKAAEAAGVHHDSFTLHHENEDLHRNAATDVSKIGLTHDSEISMLPKSGGTVHVTARELKNNSELWAARLQTDPELTIVIDVSSTGLASFTQNSIPENVRHLKIEDSSSLVRFVGNDFLASCYSLVTVDLTGLKGVAFIGGNFLSGCTSLRKVLLPPCVGLVEVKPCFLSYCESLESVDLSSLGNVTVLGHGFLAYCRSLTALDISPLQRVVSIGDCSLMHCSSLVSVDLSQLRCVASIGDYFLKGSSLTHANLRTLQKRNTTVGRGFLDGTSVPTVQRRLREPCGCLLM
eukprot:TRINITY_DN10277_c1_g1_i1.p1 TRINITY_DN10277_c1_g1~~TRINITY_DN10277_c1_g1_i1.p1  ORF type:complete len:320 (+),score=39.02 TRINITY_DN10277_c1_g1_i1:64-1023(+)